MTHANLKRSARWEQAYQDALEQHEMFYNLPAKDQSWEMRVLWPSPQTVLGEAQAIGYTSDKFDREWRDYIHKHSHPYPQIIHQAQAGEDRVTPLLRAPQPPVWAFLGWCLDLQFDRGRGVEHLDWKSLGKKRLPLLAWEESRRILIIQPRHVSEPALLLTSPILTVTAHGIEY